MVGNTTQDSRYNHVVVQARQASIDLENFNIQAALDIYAQLLEIAKQMERSQLVAVLLNRMGQALQLKGEIQDAVVAFESALRALAQERSLDLQQVTRKLNQVSKEYTIQKPQPLPDLYASTNAESLAADENDPALAIKLLIHIGNAYLQQPQEGPALKAYEQALNREAIQQNPLLHAYVLANISEIYRRQDNLDAAATHLSQALELFDQQSDPLEKRRALALLAGIARDRNQPDQAIALYQQAIALYQRANDSTGMGKTYAVLASLYLEQERYAEAQPLFHQALAIAKSQPDQEILWFIHWGIGCCQYQDNSPKNAVVSFEESLEWIDRRQQELRTDEGKVTFFENVQDVFEKLVLVHLELAQAGEQSYEPALEVAERARGQALLDLMQGRGRRRPKLVDAANTPDTEPAPDPEPVIETELNLADGPQQMAAGTPVFPSNMAMQSAMGVGANTPLMSEPVEVDDVTQAIVEPEPLSRLVFYSLSDRTAIFVAKPDGQVTGHVVPLGDEAISERVTQLRKALQVDEVTRKADLRKAMVVGQVEPVEPVATDLNALLHDWYAEFVAPVADALPADNSTIVIEPHCALWLVPFAALRLADGTWMCDLWSLVYAPSLQTLEQIRREPAYAPVAEAKLLAMGNPVMPTATLPDGSPLVFSPLPGAEDEVDAIAQLFSEANRTLLIQAEATEARVKELALSHNIVHLATHGVAFSSTPLESLVVFSQTDQENGLLTAREVIRSASLPADLVVLSACQTGLGRIAGEGMLGLSRAFLVVGARTLLASQWSVSDSATKELMVAFYRHYLEHGHKANALQAAMQEVRAKGDCSHPRYWAAFGLVGAEV